MISQTSLNGSVKIGGINIYNGRRNYATFHPAEEDTGIVFRALGEDVRASLDGARNKRRAIFVSNGGGGEIGLVEHLLSATYVLGIDNAVVELSDGICPTTPNCALEYFLALKDARSQQSAGKKFWRYCMESPTAISWGHGKPDNLAVSRADGCVVDYTAYYPHRVVGKQHHRLRMGEDEYEAQVSKARPPGFVFNRALGKALLWVGEMGWHGIDERNYLLITSKNSEVHLNPPGFGPRYGGEEFVRHKMLDVVGTLALAGRQFVETEFRFHMTGHNFDLYAIRKLFDGGYFVDG